MPSALHFTVHHTNAARRASVFAMPPPRSSETIGPSQPLRRLRRILVATDGTENSHGAMTMAGILARHHGSIVDVVSVLPRWGPPAPDHALLDVTRELLDERLAHVVPQSERTIRDAAHVWTIRVVDSNSVADSIADTARAEGHDLIIVGTRRGWFDRWFRRPTALAVARCSEVPVLVVPHSVSALPRSAVVVVDGSDADFSIATSLGRILGEDAVVDLVHDRPDAPDGEPAPRLSAYAKRTGADLIAVRLPGSAAIADDLRGSAGRRFLRTTDGCVLLLPPQLPSPVQHRRVRHA